MCSVETVKLCDCGCGDPAPVAPCTDRSKGWVKGQPLRFRKGHQHRGKRRPSGEDSPSWKGEDATSCSIHQHLANRHPKTGACEECGAEGLTDYAYLHHPNRHTRDRADYRELCRRCHWALDRPSRLRPKLSAPKL